VRHSHRTSLALLLIICSGAALLGQGATGRYVASAQDLSAPETIASSAPAVEIAGNGLSIESALEEIGLGEMWREETALSARSRHMLIRYPGPTTLSAITSLITVVADLERTEALRSVVNNEGHRITAWLGIATVTENRLTHTLGSNPVRLDSIQDVIESIAINRYMNHGANNDEAAAIGEPNLLLTRRGDELVSAALDRLISERGSLTEALHAAQDTLPEVRGARTDAMVARKQLSDTARQLPGKIDELRTRAAELLPAAAEAFLSAEVVDEPGLSLRALDAYFNAETWMDESQPECGITWQTIGAIGLVESRHGTHAGNRLLPDGRTQYQIIGATLDGTTIDNFGQSVSVVTDTDGGVYDGDPVHDRAVGPMQFIPETWQQWSVDADGDGRRDPNDMDDASVATARYLCANGPIKSAAAWDAAIYTYNQSKSYVDSIRSAYHHLDDTVSKATIEPLDDSLADQ